MTSFYRLALYSTILFIASCNNHDRENGYYQFQIDDLSEIETSYLNEGMPWIIPRDKESNLDSMGIPMVKYSFGEFYNPVTTSHNALAFHQSYLSSGNKNDSLAFLKNADWLLTKMDSVGYLHYNFKFKHAGHTFKKGWTSGMAQGEALSVLSIAYNYTGSKSYLEGAERLFSTFKDDSTVYSFMMIEDNYLYLEEYPNPRNCHVLNGMIFGAWGLWDYYVVSKSQNSKDMFLGLLTTIMDNYRDWDLDNNLTKYCLHNHVNESYHRIHLKQVESIYNRFNRHEFKEILEEYAS